MGIVFYQITKLLLIIISMAIKIINFSFRMSFHVFFHISSVQKSLVTNAARKWLLPRMDAHMNFNITEIGKLCTAQITTVRPCIPVTVHVPI